MDNPASRPGPAIGRAILCRLRSPLLIGVAGLFFCWPALYNGYPLLWYDTGGYLRAGWLSDYSGEGAGGMRSPVYGLAIIPLLRLQSAWPIVIVQAGISAAMIFLVLRTVLGRLGAGQYLLLIGLLALLTSLPWHASMIMADVYAGLLPLGFYLLAFARDRLARWEVALVFAVTCLATLVHYSHLPLAAALALVASGALLLERRPIGEVIRCAWLCLAAVVATIAAHAGLQWAIGGTPAVSPNASVFFLARLVEDGPAGTYLAAHCPERHFALCGFAGDMPMSTTQFLWSDHGPVKRLGGAAALRDEARTIVAGTLREHPGEIARFSLLHTLRQLQSFRTSGYVRNFSASAGDWQSDAALIQDKLPAEYTDFTRSRQAMGNIGMEWIFSSQTPTVVVSIVLLLASLYWILFRSDRRLREILWLSLATVVCNAAICGALSGPSNRYESRVIWLLPLLAHLVSVSGIDAWKRSRTSAAATAPT